MTCVLIRDIRDRKGEDTQKHRGEGHVKTKAETGILLPQAMERQEPPEAGETGKDSPLEAPERM